MKKSVIIIIALLLVAALVAVAVFVIVPKQKYQKALELLESGEYDAAASAFTELGGYSDSATMAQEAQYRKAVACLEKSDFDTAIQLFTNLADYADSPELLNQAKYNKALRHMFCSEYKDAYLLLTELGDYENASEARTQLVRSWAEHAVSCNDPGNLNMTMRQALEDNYKDYKNIYEGLAAELVSTFEGSEAEYDIIHSTVTSYIDGLGDFSYYYRQENVESVDIARALMSALPDSYMGEPEIKPFVAVDNEFLYVEILGCDANIPGGILINARVENRCTENISLLLQLPAANGLSVNEMGICHLLAGEKSEEFFVLDREKLGGSEAGPITGIRFECDGIGPDVDGDRFGDSMTRVGVEIYPYGVYWYQPYEHEPDADDVVVFDGENSDFIITDYGFNGSNYELDFWVSNMYGNQCIGEQISLKVNGIEVQPDPFLIFYRPFTSFYDRIIIPVEELQAKGIDEIIEIEFSIAIQEWPEGGVSVSEEAPTIEDALAMYGQEKGTVTIKPNAAA